MSKIKIIIIISAVLVIGGLVAYFLFFTPQNQFPNSTVQDIIYPMGVIKSPRGDNSASTTLSIPKMQPDMDLGLPGTRLIAPALEHDKTLSPWNASSWIFVEKNGAIHAEYIYGIEFLDETQKSDNPKLVPEGVIYTDIYGTVRKFTLADLATIKNIADPASLHFVKGSDSYLADKQKVYFLKSLAGGPAFDPAIFSIDSIPAADPETFTVLSKLAHFDLAVDNHAVYLHGEVQADIDRATFQTLKADYSYRDEKNVYVATGPVTPTGIEWMLEKRPITNLEKKIDSDSIYYSTDGQTVFLNKNMLDVLYNGKVLERTPILGADPNTFVQLTGLLGYYISPGDGTKPQYIYGRDANHVYYKGVSLVGADPKTFVPIENGGLLHSYGADQKHVYFEEKILLGADINTFIILWAPPREGCPASQYSKDANHVYFNDQVVVGADPETFEALIKDYGRDKRGIYNGLQFDSTLPKDFKPVCNYG